MTRCMRTIAALTAVVLPSLALAWNDVALRKIEEKKEKAERMEEHRRGEIYSEISRALAEVLNDQLTASQTQDAGASLEQLISYSRKATAAAKIKGKDIKDTEINLRKTSRRLEEISRTVSVTERAPLKQAITDLEKMRDELLRHMFTKR